MSDDLISRSSVIKGIDELMESPYANSPQFGAERKETMGLVKALCVKGLHSGYDPDEVVEQLKSVSIPEDKVLCSDPDKFGVYVRLEDAIKIVKAEMKG